MTCPAKHESERRCIYTRMSVSRDQLIRFAVSPSGEIVADLEEKLPGRGLWLTSSADIVSRACAENVFSRAARRNVTIPCNLSEQLVSLLDRRCMDLIALARRSGSAVTGFEKVMKALAVKNVAVLIEAIDGADDGRKKIARKAAGIDALSLWTAGQLGAPFRRDRAVHVAISSGGLAKRLIRDGRRLEGLRSKGVDADARVKLQES